MSLLSSRLDSLSAKGQEHRIVASRKFLLLSFWDSCMGDEKGWTIGSMADRTFAAGKRACQSGCCCGVASFESPLQCTSGVQCGWHHDLLPPETRDPVQCLHSRITAATFTSLASFLCLLHPGNKQNPELCCARSERRKKSHENPVGGINSVIIWLIKFDVGWSWLRSSCPVEDHLYVGLLGERLRKETST
jgi:hypothetical protein